MVLVSKKNLLTFMVLSFSSIVLNASLNPIQQMVAQSPVDPVALAHGLVPKKMTELFTYGALASALIPTAYTMFKVYLRGNKECTVVAPVAAELGKDVGTASSSSIRLGYFSIEAQVPKNGNMLSKLCQTRLSVTGVTPGNVAAALGVAYLTRVATGKK